MKTILLFLFALIAVSLNAQIIGLNMGSQLVPEKVLFENSISPGPRPFTQIGLTYINNKGVSASLSYTFDLHIVTLSSTIPLFNLRKGDDSFALVNRRKKK